ncbi:OmpA family protein, partial [Leptospira borgpetersenii serovar Hardjo-bovis]|nr:OmpA family protein [Leptospira borgpetersenii serovar Hardjo-bovis]
MRRRLRKVVQQRATSAVHVAVFCSNSDERELHVKLCRQRAESVASALITQGVAANRIRTSGMGPANPVASNSTEEGKAQNRRVEITLSPLQ